MLRFSNKNELATKVSYEVTHLIAKHMKPFSDAELLKDCIENVVNTKIYFIIFLILNKYMTKFQICSYLTLYITKYIRMVEHL
jgi:hypothetical protein